MAAHSSVLARRTPMDRGAWRATVRGVTQSRTQVKRLHTHRSDAEHGSKDKPVNKREKSFLQFFPVYN